MAQLDQLVNSVPMAEYIERQYSNSIPYLGETLFPATKKRGLSLEFFKSYDEVPVSLQPSAFDAKATVRDRIGVSTVKTSMPFFRESMRIGEEERQELFDLLDRNDGKNPYLADALDRIYDDAYRLTEGARVVPERERISLLIDGTINISGDNGKGRAVSYSYNYDPNGTWKSTNTSTVTTSWSDADNSDPIADIIKAKDALRSEHGIEATRGIISSNTWAQLKASSKVKGLLITPYQNIILTDTVLSNLLAQYTGITFTVYDKVWKDASGATHRFYPDGYITIFPAGTLGRTVFGTTPEEADLLSGQASASVSVVNTGIAVTTFKEPHPVNIVTVVSEIVLPSFENMSSVYTLKTEK